MASPIIQHGQAWDREVGPLYVLESMDEVKSLGSDILALWDDATHSKFLGPRCPPTSGSLAVFQWKRKAYLRDEFDCLKSGRRVKVSLGTCHFGGLPCIDLSPMGLRRGFLGPTGAVVITCLRLILAHEPWWAILENVCPFGFEACRRFLGSKYGAEQVNLDPRMFGWPISRRRTYGVVYLLEHVQLASPPAAFRSRLGSVGESASASCFLWDFLGDRELTPAQGAGLASYGILFGPFGLADVVDLSQNAQARLRKCDREGAWPTLTCGCRSFCVSFSTRFVSTDEFLAAQGLPASRRLARRLGRVSTPY